MARWWTFSRAWRRAPDADLDRELTLHLELETEALVEKGLDRDSARLAARRALGNRTRIAEAVYELTPAARVERWVRDLLIGVVGLRRHPLFTLVVTLSLALAIGANTAIFTFSDRLILRTLPVDRPHEVVSIHWSGPSCSGDDAERALGRVRHGNRVVDHPNRGRCRPRDPQERARVTACSTPAPG